MKSFFVYRHIRPDTNEVFYVGSSGYQKKWKHARAYTTTSRNKYWYQIVESCAGSFKVDIMLDGMSMEEAKIKERELIALYGRQDLGLGTLCNLTSGVMGSYDHSPQMKAFISEQCKKRPKQIIKESTRLKRSIRFSGSGNPNYGKKISEAQKELLRLSHLGKKQTKEWIEARAAENRKKVINMDTQEIHPSILSVSVIFGKSPTQTTRIIKSGKTPFKFL